MKSSLSKIILFDQSGIILAGLIIVIVLLASLGAAMLSLTGTSYSNAVMSNSSARAYYLAESGLRYLEDQYMNAGNENQKDTLLESLHGRTFTFDDDEGRFQIHIYPFYFKITEDPEGDTVVRTKVTGGYPDGLTLPESGRLKIGTSFYDYTGVDINENNITFTVGSGMPFFPVDTDVLLVAKSADSRTVNRGGNILLNATGAAFPQRNGLVEIVDDNDEHHIYSYRLCSGNTLTGIEEPLNPEMISFSLNMGTDIVLQKFINLDSRGILGPDNNPVAARTISYHLPLEIDFFKTTKKFHEIFDDKSFWDESTYDGSHEIQSTGEDNVLKVDVSPEIGVTKTLITLNRPETDTDFVSSHSSAGGFLSYDVQVKTGFDPLPDSWTFLGAHFDEYYMAGISFRLGDNYNGYGVSFNRGDNDYSWPHDGIPNELVPVNNRHMIILWEKTGTSDWEWLAYKEINFVEDFPGINPDDYPIHEATLLVRIIEAASITFTGGTVAIEDGDIITQQNGAKGRAAGNPVIKAGSWAEGDAAGIIFLNDINETDFQDGQISVTGKSSNAATVDSFRARDNYIRVFFGDRSGSGDPDGDPLNSQRHANLRGEHWPPANLADWSADDDYFTLVQWDIRNPVSSAELLIGTEETIIRTNTFTTPEGAIPDSSELGLHTFGNSSPFIYFDDFGLSLEINTEPIYLPPVRE